MRIYIVRHGETQANIDCIIQGWNDSPLTDYGVTLAEATGRGMRGIRFDRCISSPLGRARQTAEIVLRESGNIVPVETDDRIREIYLGDWENQPLADVEHDMRFYFHEPARFHGAPNGESLQQVCARTQAFLKALAARDDGQTCLVVTHGCAYRGMLNWLYDDPADYWHGQMPPNCVVSIVEAVNGVCRLTADDRLYYDPASIEGYHVGRL